MYKPDRQTVFLGSIILFVVIGLAVISISGQREGRSTAPPVPAEVHAAEIDFAELPVNAERSFRYLVQICELGPRFSGSPGMQQQQDLLERHFEQLGGQVQRQLFRVRHPLTGADVYLANLIVQWHPKRRQRILLCAHYDTRPFPDRDPDRRKRRAVFIGANDGASGVALLMEMGHLMSAFDSAFGVDFVLFDGEELVYDNDRDPYFLGSRYFAEQYVQMPSDFRYRAGILLDMVGDKHLSLFQEGHSVHWKDSRVLVNGIWHVARELGVREFIARPKHKIRDDHIMLHDVAKIPACDIIDFDYNRPGSRQSFWHTTEDTPDKCSGESLAKVGWVVWEWLNRLPQK